jgi:hypothetical protein
MKERRRKLRKRVYEVGERKKRRGKQEHGRKRKKLKDGYRENEIRKNDNGITS